MKNQGLLRMPHSLNNPTATAHCTHVHTHAHTHIHISTHSLMHAVIHKHTLSHILSHTFSLTHSLSHSHTLSHTHSHTVFPEHWGSQPGSSTEHRVLRKQERYPLPYQKRNSKRHTPSPASRHIRSFCCTWSGLQTTLSEGKTHFGAIYSPSAV